MASRVPTPFEAGRLRDRIAIRRQVDVATGRGGFARDWQTLAGMGDVPAEVIGQSGREAVIANTLQGTATFRITIRYRDGIQAKDQIIVTTMGDLELNVLAPPTDPTGRRQFLQILADTSAQQQAGS